MRLVLAVLATFVPTATLGVAGEVERFVRFADGGTARFGLLEGENIHVLQGSLFGDHRKTGETRRLGAVRLLPPVVPRTVLAVGRNYPGQRSDGGAARPELFAKLPGSLIGHGDPIPYPPDASDLRGAGALVVVIGRRARNVTVEAAPGHVFGVTAGNDVGERAWQSGDLQWLRARASDGFGPIGPVLVRGLGWGDLTIETRLNGKSVARSSTAAMIHSVAEIVSFASRYVTLEPGDVLFTGAPGRTGTVRHGDVIEVEIEGVGVLRNPVAAALPAMAPAPEATRPAARRADDGRPERTARNSEGISFLWAAAAALGIGGAALLFVLISISPARIARAMTRLENQPAERSREKETDESEPS